jgi:hypothetical protein
VQKEKMKEASHFKFNNLQNFKDYFLLLFCKQVKRKKACYAYLFCYCQRKKKKKEKEEEEKEICSFKTRGDPVAYGKNLKNLKQFTSVISLASNLTHICTQN